MYGISVEHRQESNETIYFRSYTHVSEVEMLHRADKGTGILLELSGFFRLILPTYCLHTYYLLYILKSPKTATEKGKCIPISTKERDSLTLGWCFL